VLRLSLLFFLFVAGLWQYSSAQQLNVLASDTKLPLESALIFHPKSKSQLITDAAGKADISGWKGLDKIHIHAFGYTELVKSYEELAAMGFEVRLNPLLFSLQESVVSATRWNQNRSEIPSKITVISAEERKIFNPQTAADLLGTSGEVFIQKSQQGGGSPMIRGFSTNRLLYTVDGVRMNTAIFRSGNLQNVISLDPFATQSTEVFFGPGSIIYGSDAIGAVMSFQTLAAEFVDRSKQAPVTGNVTLRGSTANKEKTGHAHLSYGGKNWSGVSSFSRHDFGDLRMGTRGPEEFLRPNYVERIGNKDVLVENTNPLLQVPSGYDQINLMQKLRFKPSERWDLQYAFHFSETSPYSRYDRLIRFRPNGQPRSAEWKYGPQIWMMNHLRARHVGNGKWYDELSVNLAYQKFEESRIDRNFNDPIRRTRTEKVDAYSVNMDLTKGFGSKGKLFYGLEWVRNDVHSTGSDENIDSGITDQGPARYPNSEWSSYAAYGTYQHRISPQSLLQAGLRYNYFRLYADFSNNVGFYPLPFVTSENRNAATTFSTGWVWTPGNSWTMHLNASTGFRSPNVDDIGKFFDSEPGTVMVPNPDLLPEYAYNLEANVGKVIGDRIMLDLTGYYTYLDDALVRRSFQLGGQDSILYDGELSKVLALQNAAFVQIVGLQAAVEVKFTRELSLTSRLNIQKGTEEMENGDKSPSRHAPPTFGQTRLEFKKENWWLMLYSDYSGGFSFEQLPLEERGKPELYAVDANGNPYSPSWATINLKGYWKINKLLSTSLGFENLTDVRYRTYSSGIAAPGRNFILSLMANF
jgi:hemoglobin/transferrin/lactoferrin receptor protein